MENVNNEVSNEVVETTETEAVDEVEVKKVETNETEEKEVGLDLLNLIDKDDNIKKQFQSEVDRAITRAIQTRDKNHQEELDKQKQRANMTAEELQREKERELEEREVQLNAYQLQLDKVDYFKTNGLDMNLIDYINVDSKDEIEEKTTQLIETVEKVAENMMKEKLRKNGISMGDREVRRAMPQTVEDLAKLSTEQINQYFNTQK